VGLMPLLRIRGDGLLPVRGGSRFTNSLLDDSAQAHPEPRRGDSLKLGSLFCCGDSAMGENSRRLGGLAYETGVRIV